MSSWVIWMANHKMKFLLYPILIAMIPLHLVYYFIAGGVSKSVWVIKEIPWILKEIKNL